MHRLPRFLALRQQQLLQPRLSRLHPQRSASQYVYKTDGSRARFRAVKFKASGHGWKSTGGIIISAVGTYLIVKASMTLLVATFTEALDDPSHEGSSRRDEDDEASEAGEEEEDDDDEDVTFIPLTWATQMPRTYYRGSDPEWQEFVKFSKDKERRKRIQDELVDSLHKYTCRQNVLKNHLGKEIAIGKYWLETNYPDGPPPEYQRGGVIIGDRYIALGTQQITPEEHWRWMRILFPEASIRSTLATGGQLIQMNFRRIKQALGIEAVDPKSPEERLRRLMAKQEQNPSQGIGKAGSSISSANDPAAVVNPVPDDTALSSLVSAETDKRYPWYFLKWQPPGQSGAIDGQLAYVVFHSTLRKHWNPKNMEPPRGSFLVQGMVEMKGERGRLLWDVKAFYDPLDSKWLLINAGIRAHHRKNQNPRGDSLRPPPL